MIWKENKYLRRRRKGNIWKEEKFRKGYGKCSDGRE